MGNQKIKLWLAEHGVSDVRTQDKAVKEAIARTELHKEFFIGTLDFLKDEEGRASSPGISEKGTVLDPRTQAEKLVVVVLDKKTGKITQEQDHYRDAEKRPMPPVKKRVRNRAKNRGQSKNRNISKN